MMSDFGEVNLERSGSSEKYLTFALGDEEYGMRILQVREIIGIMPITCLPQTPNHMRGVINLRGRVIPVIDLRLKFGMDQVEYTRRTCIIVVEISSFANLIGILVDSVSEVLDIQGDCIEDVPELNATVNTPYILGMAKIDDGVKILLNLDRIIKKEPGASFLENAA